MKRQQSDIFEMIWSQTPIQAVLNSITMSLETPKRQRVPLDFRLLSNVTGFRSKSSGSTELWRNFSGDNLSVSHRSINEYAIHDETNGPEEWFELILMQTEKRESKPSST